MITPSNSAQKLGSRYRRPMTWYGLSTDAKPTENVINSSVFVEMDTGKLYFYDQTNEEWLEWGG